jgi:polyphosphate kinase
MSPDLGRPQPTAQVLNGAQPVRTPSSTNVGPGPSKTIDLHAPALYTNRELSWLEFNQRVLDQALDDSHPLLERIKFLSIVASNLDEFFMVRVATVLRHVASGHADMSPDGLSPVQQLHAIRRRVATLLKDQGAAWNDVLRPALAAQGVRLLEPEEYDERTRRCLASWFRTDVYPLLTPLAFDPGHPFPHISNRSANIAVVLRHDRRRRFARVKVPPLLPRFVPLPASAGHAGFTFAFLEDIIRLNLGELFPGVEVQGAYEFRVVRDSDIDLREDATGSDLMAQVDRSLRELRDGPPVLLHVDDAMPRRVLNILVDNFEVDDDIVIRSRDRLGFSDWAALYRLPLPALKYPPFVPHAVWPAHPRGTCVFDDIREEDVLVQHPFDSFSAVEAFVRDAAVDPHVLAIKMTLYRIGQNSPLIDFLIEAADSGKQVAVLVELKARFDERNNIEWASRLENAGVHVVYGVEQLKTHTKLCLVVRREAHGIQRYAHIGTGNYNRGTAQAYTDFGLFTADPAILDDITDVFNALTGYSKRRTFHQMLVAPTGLRAGLVARIEREIEHARRGAPARLIFKANALTDPVIIRALYRASRAGVEVDLLVRGICCLRPGVPDVSERIRVRSIVGRFLEHSRAYWFFNGGDEELFLGSADLMERNMDRRVETLCRVRDTAILRYVRDVVLEAYLRDNQHAYELHDARYVKLAPLAGEPLVDAQQSMIDLTAAVEADEKAEADTDAL